MSDALGRQATDRANTGGVGTTPISNGGQYMKASKIKGTNSQEKAPKAPQGQDR